jgi:UPF0755 protein
LKKSLLFVFVSFAILLVICAIAVTDLWMYANNPATAEAGEVLVYVKPGQPFSETSRILFEKQLIRSPFRFNLLARYKGYDKKLQAGEYLLSGAESPLSLMEKLVNGEVKLYKITIPEGYNIKQIAELAANAGFGDKDKFIAAATDATFVRQSGIEADSFEGYLFPDTYFFPRGTDSRKIIATMVDRFRSIFKPEWKDQGKLLGLTIHQVVTLASIIEKETGVAAERPIISSVFHNRLKKRMRLESDPTVIYGIKNFNGNLTRKHLKTKTPYNTYKIRGLPHGPIANPGGASIHAALFPAQTLYIYFVSKKDKTHQFSTNLKDHNKAVKKYQLRR